MFRTLTTLLALALCHASVQAESIELLNGDTLKGNIVSMDAENVQLKSEANQLRTVPRNKIAQITFIDRPDAELRSFSVAEMLKELRADGVDDATWNDIKKRLNVGEVPEVRRYFNDTVDGLMKDWKNLRQDAEEVENEIAELRKEYGPQADTLNDYAIALRSLFGTNADADATISGKINVDVDHNAETAFQKNRNLQPANRN